MRFAHFLRGFEPLPRSDRKLYPMRLLGDDLNLIELKLDGGLTAEHGNNHADRVLFDLDVLNGAGEGAQRAVKDPDDIAHRIVDDDFLLLNAHGVDFIFRQRNGIIAGSTNKAGDSADVFDDVPGVVGVDHLDQDVTGVNLAVVGLADAGLSDLSDGLHGNGDGQDLIVEAAAFDSLLNGGFHGIFITGVGMQNIPSCSFSHGSLPLVKGADQGIDAELSNKVEQPDEHAHCDDAANDHQGVLQNLLRGGPNDLLQLAAELTEVLADLAPGSFEPVFLFDFCHFGASLLGLVVSGVLSAESAVLLHFETVGVILLVLHGVVVSLLALRASQSDFHAHNGTSLIIASLYHPV